MNDSRFAGLMAIALTVPFLQGCTAGLIAMQAVPAAIGGVAMAGTENRSPFAVRMPTGTPRTDQELALLDEHIQRAQCGEAESQYWLGSALKNDFNATPNNVEIYKWYLLAEMRDFEPAREKLAALGSTMPESEITEAQARAEAWRPASQGCPVTG